MRCTYQAYLLFHVYMCIIFLLIACLCVHVLESRPSLVALCLRDGSVYMKSS